LKPGGRIIAWGGEYFEWLNLQNRAKGG